MSGEEVELSSRPGEVFIQQVWDGVLAFTTF